MKVCRGKILVKPADAAVPYGESGLVLPVTGDSSAIPGEIVVIGPPTKEELEARKLDPGEYDENDNYVFRTPVYTVGSKILFNRVTTEKVHLPGEPLHYLIEEKHIQVILP